MLSIGKCKAVSGFALVNLGLSLPRGLRLKSWLEPDRGYFFNNR